LYLKYHGEFSECLLLKKLRNIFWKKIESATLLLIIEFKFSWDPHFTARCNNYSVSTIRNATLLKASTISYGEEKISI